MRFERRSQNRLRKHKLNVAVYDANFGVHLTEDIVIGDKQELTEIEIEFKGPVKAIVLNHGDQAYAKVRYDSLQNCPNF